MRAFLLLGCFLVSSAAARTHVWIDTDPAIGPPWREVDDAYALVLAFRSPELGIAGISSTYGNAGIARTTAVARELVRQFGSATVYRGAGSRGDFAKSEASTALAAALHRQPLTYLALGPLTNLAAVLQQEPALARRIEQIIFVGGQSSPRDLVFGPNDRLRIHDANVFKDPDAARTVLRARIPIVLIPIGTAAELRLTPSNLRELRNDGAAGKFLARRSGAWMWFWARYVHERGGPIFDAAAIMQAARPEFTRNESRYARMDAHGNLLVSAQRTEDSRRIVLCVGLRPGSAAFVLGRLCSR